MRIVGEWRLFSDGVKRPIITAEMVDANGERVSVRFLVDSGADCTALNAATIEKLQLPQQPSPSDTRIRGITGDCDYVTIQSAIDFKRDDGGAVTVRGDFLGSTSAAITPRAECRNIGLSTPDEETITVLRLASGAYIEAGVRRRGESAESIVLNSFAVDVGAVFDAD